MMLSHDFSQTIVLRIKDGKGDTCGIVTIDITEDGIDIRNDDQCKLEASRSTVVNVDCDHCQGCPDEDETVADRIGLTPDEANTLSRWRTRKQDGIDSKVLGDILDKVVRQLDKRSGTCETEAVEVVIEVESP